MLKMKPVTEPAEVKALCEEHSVPYADGMAGYRAYQDDLCGVALFTMDAYNMDLLYIDYPEKEPYVADGLIRAVANYGANRSAYVVRTAVPADRTILTRLSFEEQNGVYIGKIPKILLGTCQDCGQ